MGWTRDAPFAGLTRIGGGGALGVGVGLGGGGRRPLADVVSIETKSNPMANTEQVVVSNIIAVYAHILGVWVETLQKN